MSSPDAFLEWIQVNYVTAVAVGIRRITDSDRRSVSLGRLLYELIEHPRTVTRRSNRALYRGVSIVLAETSFDGIVGTRFSVLPGSAAREPHFRNPSGVAMKLSNFLRFDADYRGAGLERGGKLDAEVWKEFAHDRPRLSRTAAAIVAAVEKGELPQLPLEDDEEDAPEGAVLTREHRSRERSRRLIQRKKAVVLAASGRLACEGCGFDFERTYGELGSGFAECHHTRPVSELKPGQRTRLADLAIVCANCHRMIHRRRPWPAVEELKALVRKPR